MDTAKTLETAPQKKQDAPNGYITLIEGVGGWNSCHMTFDEDCGGIFTPQDTGFNNTSMGDGSKQGAIGEANEWARMDELPMWRVNEQQKTEK